MKGASKSAMIRLGKVAEIAARVEQDGGEVYALYVERRRGGELVFQELWLLAWFNICAPFIIQIITWLNA